MPCGDNGVFACFVCEAVLHFLLASPIKGVSYGEEAGRKWRNRNGEGKFSSTDGLNPTLTQTHTDTQGGADTLFPVGERQKFAFILSQTILPFPRYPFCPPCSIRPSFQRRTFRWKCVLLTINCVDQFMRAKTAWRVSFCSFGGVLPAGVVGSERWFAKENDVNENDTGCLAR